MPELDDIALLRQYAEGNSETAFTALVERHLNLVYSTALRRAGSPPAAEEITQAVFILLAKKAKSLGNELDRPLRDGFTTPHSSRRQIICAAKSAANSANRRRICNPF